MGNPPGGGLTPELGGSPYRGGPGGPRLLSPHSLAEAPALPKPVRGGSATDLGGILPTSTSGRCPRSPNRFGVDSRRIWGVDPPRILWWTVAALPEPVWGGFATDLGGGSSPHPLVDGARAPRTGLGREMGRAGRTSSPPCCDGHLSRDGNSTSPAIARQPQANVEPRSPTAPSTPATAAPSHAVFRIGRERRSATAHVTGRVLSGLSPLDRQRRPTRQEGEPSRWLGRMAGPGDRGFALSGADGLWLRRVRLR